MKILCFHSDTPTKKGHLMILTDASQNTWEKRWFVLRRWFYSILFRGGYGLIRNSFRPYLHMYLHSNELEELGVISLDGVNVESDPQKEILLGVRGSLLRILTRVLSLHSNASHLLCSPPPIRMPSPPPISKSCNPGHQN